eukprot:GHVT01023586.1.p1 GENE.GHVT01023586.1~~GHVT01023586.1.p1  ORF type:complete len:202 (+),score=51.31 GHVT01023586.1:276-881(+)
MDLSVISGMRRNSDVAIYVDVARALRDGIAFYEASNSVILSDGLDGVLPVCYFQVVKHMHWGVVLYEHGVDFTDTFRGDCRNDDYAFDLDATTLYHEQLEAERAKLRSSPYCTYTAPLQKSNGENRIQTQHERNNADRKTKTNAPPPASPADQLKDQRNLPTPCPNNLRAHTQATRTAGGNAQAAARGRETEGSSERRHGL